MTLELAGQLKLSADATFRGVCGPDRVVPEQRPLAAASSCQLLSFLAMAANAGVDVMHYEDDAEAVMPEVRDRMRITRIVLRPDMVVAAGTDLWAGESAGGQPLMTPATSPTP